MALEPGGRADKLGGRFEQNWAVLQALRVLAGEATSVLPEGLGADERGVDVWVREDNHRTACQCKAENGTQGKWTVSGLAGVLRKAQYQLGRDAEYRFAFVSADPAPELHDLSDRTTRCNNDPKAFYDYEVTTSKAHSDAFHDLCDRLGLDPKKPEDLTKGFDFLTRFEILHFPRSGQGEELLRLYARSILRGAGFT